ncbi:Nn.00g007880.m01.CDS01 [Neocucurbitaria sp. VM-36]
MPTSPKIEDSVFYDTLIYDEKNMDGEDEESEEEEENKENMEFGYPVTITAMLAPKIGVGFANKMVNISTLRDPEYIKTLKCLRKYKFRINIGKWKEEDVCKHLQNPNNECQDPDHYCYFICYDEGNELKGEVEGMQSMKLPDIWKPIRDFQGVEVVIRKGTRLYLIPDDPMEYHENLKKAQNEEVHKRDDWEGFMPQDEFNLPSSESSEEL